MIIALANRRTNSLPRLLLATEWYLKAAEHFPDLGGAGQGRNSLGLLYMQGLGVPQDYI
jgi:TPR repeat protein